MKLRGAPLRSDLGSFPYSAGLLPLNDSMAKAVSQAGVSESAVVGNPGHFLRIE
jgi:hypothetical protein